jgi:hypothetical protein
LLIYNLILPSHPTFHSNITSSFSSSNFTSTSYRHFLQHLASSSSKLQPTAQCSIHNSRQLNTKPHPLFPTPRHAFCQSSSRTRGRNGSHFPTSLEQKLPIRSTSKRKDGKQVTHALSENANHTHDALNKQLARNQTSWEQPRGISEGARTPHSSTRTRSQPERHACRIVRGDPKRDTEPKYQTATRSSHTPLSSLQTKQ